MYLAMKIRDTTRKESKPSCFLVSSSMFVTGTSERNSQDVLLRLTFRQERIEDIRGDPIPTLWVPFHTAMVSAVALDHSAKTIPEKGHPFSF